MYLKYFIFLLSLLSVSTVVAQGLGNAPYTRLGVGDYKLHQGSIRNIGMGGAGIAARSAHYINWINPASLCNFKGLREDSLLKIDVGFAAQYKWLNDGQNTNTDFGLNIQHILIQFPLAKRMNGTLGLMPLTSVENNYQTNVPVQNDPNGASVNYNYLGSGGIYHLNFGFGYGVTKHVALGLGSSVLFGSIKQESTSQVVIDPSNPTSQKKVGFYDQASYSGFLFRPSILVRKAIGEYVYSKKAIDTMNVSEEDKQYYRTLKVPQAPIFSFGASVDLYTPTKTKQEVHYVERDLLDKYIIDSVIGTRTGTTYLPLGFRLGAGYEKAGKWALFADYTFTQWSTYQNSEIKSDILNNSFLFQTGGEWVKINENKPARSITYRAGFYMGQSYYTLLSENVTDRGITLGASIPVGSTAGNRYVQPVLTKLNTGIMLGQLHVVNQDLIRESYIRLFVSMNIYSGWYGKRRIH